MNSLGKLFVAFVVLVAGLLFVMWMTVPSGSGPTDAQVKAHLLTTDGIEATCGHPDRVWSDQGAIAGTLTYAYDRKGAYVHFMVLEGKPPIAVSVSRGKRTYRLDSPEVGNILPCALR